MDPATLIAHYGYLAVAIGCLLEGETVLVLAGFAAHGGHLGLPQVILVAAATGFAGDQFFFWLGRRHGAGALRRFPSAAAHAARVQALIERYHEWVIVGVRFAYGLRIAGPVLIGTSDVPAWRFVLFNALGAAIWASAVALAGWFLGHLAQALLGNLRRIEFWLLLALALAGVALWWRRRRHARR